MYKNILFLKPSEVINTMFLNLRKDEIDIASFDYKSSKSSDNETK